MSNDLTVQEIWDPVIAAEVRARLPAKRKINKQDNLEALQQAHDCVGGFARLAHEANQDYKWFASRFLNRLLPDEKQELDVNVHIHPAIPRSPLDGEFTDVTDNHPGDQHLLQQGGSSPLIGSAGGETHPASQDGESGAFPESKDS